MRTSPSAATRLFLLALLIGLFASAWAGDGAVQTAPSVTCRVYPLPQSIASRRPLHDIEGMVEQRRALPAEMVSFRPELPPSLAPGRYRVVDEIGSVGFVAIPSTAAEDLTSRDLYIHDGSDGIRRYFIRIQTGSDDRRATSGMESRRQ